MDRHEKTRCDGRIRFSLSQEMIAILMVGVTLAGILLANMVAMRAEVRAEAQARDEAARAEAQSDRSVVDTGLPHSLSNTER